MKITPLADSTPFTAYTASVEDQKTPERGHARCILAVYVFSITHGRLLLATLAILAILASLACLAFLAEAVLCLEDWSSDAANLSTDVEKSTICIEGRLREVDSVIRNEGVGVDLLFDLFIAFQYLQEAWSVVASVSACHRYCCGLHVW